MRIVLDANVLISGLISPRGSPARILNLWKQERFDLVVSEPILEELERVIHYPRIQKRYQLPEERIEQFLRLIAGEAILAKPSSEISVTEKDPADNRYLECAVAGDASYIISGDKHLLQVEEYQGIVILNPTGFLAAVAAGGQGEDP